jgi:hypothetical protein
VRGIQPWFSYRKLNLAIRDDGKDTVIAGDKITYITYYSKKPGEIGNVMEELMMHEPSKR